MLKGLIIQMYGARGIADCRFKSALRNRKSAIIQ
jgi:hypothetical protein